MDGNRIVIKITPAPSGDGLLRVTDAMLQVIRNHRRAAYNLSATEYEGLTVTPIGIDPQYCPADLLSAARSESDRMLNLGE